MGHAETLKSTLAELAQHENKLNFISTGRVQGRKKPNAVWDLAILYVFIEQYLHPSSVTLTFSGNHFKLGLKWTYSAYDFVLLFEGDLGEIGSITLTYPVSDAPPIFQWTMGDLKLGALFNFFSWALTCSVHAIKDIYANLIVSQKLTNTIETKFVGVFKPGFSTEWFKFIHDGVKPIVRHVLFSLVTKIRSGLSLSQFPLSFY